MSNSLSNQDEQGRALFTSRDGTGIVRAPLPDLATSSLAPLASTSPEEHSVGGTDVPPVLSGESISIDRGDGFVFRVPAK